ncbi:MAG: glycosyltransferase family 4 protein [Sandaracinaceae bacterium]
MARIGVLTTSYPRHAGDPSGSFVREMCCALRDRGHHLDVLAPAAREPRTLDDEGIDVREVRYAPRSLTRTFYGAGVPDNVSRDPLAWPGLATFPIALLRGARAAAPRWDAIVSHWGLPCGLVGGLARGVPHGRVPRGRVPHLAIQHSADVHWLRRMPARGAIASRLASGADALWFVSSKMREEFLDWLPPAARARAIGRAHAHAMGFSIAAPSASRRALRAGRGAAFSVLALGRLVPVKGLDVLIRALAGERDVELVVAGDGPERAPLTRLACGLGVSTRFVGELGAQRKADALYAADALVLPSVRLASGRTEGTPVVLLEAAAAGLPIVASAVGGVDEILTDDRSALLVAPSDPDALRRAVRRLREDAALRARLSRNAKRVASRYRWPRVAELAESLLFA